MKHVLLVLIIVMYYARYWRQNSEQKFPSKKNGSMVDYPLKNNV